MCEISTYLCGNFKSGNTEIRVRIPAEKIQVGKKSGKKTIACSRTGGKCLSWWCLPQ